MLSMLRISTAAADLPEVPGNLAPETGKHLVFNRTVALRNTWAKIQKKRS